MGRRKCGKHTIYETEMDAKSAAVRASRLIGARKSKLGFIPRNLGVVYKCNICGKWHIRCEPDSKDKE